MCNRPLDPVVEVGASLNRDPEDLPVTAIAIELELPLHKPFPLEPVQCAVDLSEVQLPEAPGRLVETRLEFVPVHLLRGQKPQHGVSDRHVVLSWLRLG